MFQEIISFHGKVRSGGCTVKGLLYLICIGSMFTACTVESNGELGSNDILNGIPQAGDSVTVSYELLLGKLYDPIDDIVFNIHRSAGDEILTAKLPSLHEDKYTVVFNVLAGEQTGISYTCSQSGVLHGRNGDIVDVHSDTTIVARPDNVPYALSIGKDTVIYVGDKLMLNPLVTDDSDNILYGMDYFGTGTYSVNYNHVYTEPGIFSVVVYAEDPFSAIYDTLTVTVVEYADPKESSSSVILPSSEAPLSSSSSIFSSSSLPVSSSILEELSTNVTVVCFVDMIQQDSCKGEFGTVMPENFIINESVSSKSLVYSLQEGFSFQGFTEGDNTLLNGNSVLVASLGGIGIVEAHFQRKVYPIEISVEGNGRVSPSVISIKHNVNEVVAFEVTIEPGNVFMGWKMDGGCELTTGYVMHNDTLELACIQQGAVTAIFAPQVSRIALDVSEFHGVLHGPSVIVNETISPDDAYNKKVIWGSSNIKVATVSEGVVTAVGIGVSSITATTEDGGHTALTQVIVDGVLDSRLNTQGVAQTYGVAQIGSQAWMTENLNYETVASTCYDNVVTNCDTYGRLYTWHNAQTVCPIGWHLPTKAEWTTLAQHVGTVTGNDSTTSYRWVGIGNNLKADSDLWLSDSSGTDDFGFSAVPGGYHHSTAYSGIGTHMFFWTATEDVQEHAIYFDLRSNDNLQWYHDKQSNEFAVRCLMD